MLWRAPEEPRKRNLHRRGIEALSHFRQRIRLQWSEPAKWKERNVGDAVAGKVRYERIVGPMCQVVLILDADDGTIRRASAICAGVTLLSPI